VPPVLFLTVILLWPLAQLMWRSFVEPEPGVGNYTDLAGNTTFRTVLVRTLRMSTIVTLVAFAAGYPYAYLMTLVRPKTRALMVALVLLPFWTSLMARTFAWLVLLQDTGVINNILESLGLGRVALIRNATGVTIGMTQLLLPFMVLPLYATMSKIDRRLVDAAISLGANPRTAFLRVYFPLSMPGVVAGLTLVYILALGFYITPRILGSPQQSMISQLIGTRIDRLLDFGGAGAMSVVLLGVTFILLAIMSRIIRPSAALGVGGVEE
jgi:putative spermidine/putrescine transport system permease protein